MGRLFESGRLLDHLRYLIYFFVNRKIIIFYQLYRKLCNKQSTVIKSVENSFLYDESFKKL